jgi:hypothetical protein
MAIDTYCAKGCEITNQIFVCKKVMLSFSILFFSTFSCFFGFGRLVFLFENLCKAYTGSYINSFFLHTTICFALSYYCACILVLRNEYKHCYALCFQFKLLKPKFVVQFGFTIFRLACLKFQGKVLT